MVERNLLIGRRLIRSEYATNYTRPWRRASDVRQLLILERLHNSVEVGGRGDVKPPEQNGAAPLEPVLQPPLAPGDGVHQRPTPPAAPAPAETDCRSLSIAALAPKLHRSHASEITKRTHFKTLANTNENIMFLRLLR